MIYSLEQFADDIRSSMWPARPPTFDSLLLPGGVIAEHCIIPIEEQYQKTVFTNWNTEIWSSLVHPGIIRAYRGLGPAPTVVAARAVRVPTGFRRS